MNQAALALEIPTTEPVELRAGDDWEFDIESPTDFLASAGWQLSYYLRGEKDLTLAWGTEVTADGDTFEIRVGTSKTDLPPGPYRFYRVFTKGTQRRTELLDESFQLLPNPGTGVNAKSFNRRMLDAIETALEAWAPDGAEQAISINGRAITYRSREEVQNLRAHYLLLVELERDPDQRIEHAVRFVGA